MPRKSLFFIGISIGAGFVLTQLTVSTYVPAMPHLAVLFSKSANDLKITLMIVFFGYALGQLIWGTLSDHFGRRRIGLVALLLYTICAFFVAASYQFIQFCFTYGALGFVTAAFTSVGNAMLKDIYGKEKVARAISYVGVAMAITPSIAPVIGANLVAYFNWQAIFLFLFACALLILIAFYFIVPETIHMRERPKNPSIKKALKNILTHRVFLMYVLLLGSAFGCFTAYLDSAPFIFTHYLQASIVESGWLLLISTISYASGAVLVSQLIHRSGIAKLVKIATIISVFGSIFTLFIALLKVNNKALVLMPYIVLLLGIGMLVPLGKAGCMTALHKYAGTAASIMKFGQTVFSLIMISVAAGLNTSSTLLPISILLLAGTISSFIAARFTSN